VFLYFDSSFNGGHALWGGTYSRYNFLRCQTSGGGEMKWWYIVGGALLIAAYVCFARVPKPVVKLVLAC